MVKIIAGLKGSGKTKKLVDMVRESVATDTGDVVVIEKDKTLTYDIPYQARLIDAGEYKIASYDLFKGFLCGIHAGNYDITHVYIDNFLKLVNDKSMENIGDFLSWLDAYSSKENVEYVISISAEAESFPESAKGFIV